VHHLRHRDSTSRRRGFVPSAQVVGVLICLVLGMLAAMSSINRHDLHIRSWTSYTVRVGDTVWAIAHKTDPMDSTVDVVREILTKNGLSDAQIYPGQILVVPVGGDER
jgi:nucleoid-associated protein YgaU